ncbi:MAG: hypothetical protein WKF30_05110 [Pyrinomonadaceae bacterium]
MAGTTESFMALPMRNLTVVLAGILIIRRLPDYDRRELASCFNQFPEPWQHKLAVAFYFSYGQSRHFVEQLFDLCTLQVELFRKVIDDFRLSHLLAVAFVVVAIQYVSFASSSSWSKQLMAYIYHKETSSEQRKFKKALFFPPL